MRPSRIECCRVRHWSGRAGGWLWPAALLALTPKCALCVLAYVGVGSALGLSGSELCGASASSAASWATSLAWLGGAGVLGAIVLPASRRRIAGESTSAGRTAE